MPCYKPLQAFYSDSLNVKTGKRIISFLKSEFNSSSLIPVEDRLSLPCGRCIGCRLERSRQWALRCVHEASLYEDNCFITLTYDDFHLPSDGSLVKRDFQLFMKRFRKRFGNGIRFFHCGEYGERFQRPHYHAAIFNFDFPDKELFKTKQGIKLFVSDALRELWPFGFSTVGSLTFESAAYVARYVMKKVSGPSADDHYKGRLPEYTTMSRRPGIGKDWFDLYSSDVYPSDECIVRGRSCKPPRYYDSLLESDNPDLLAQIKVNRQTAALLRVVDNSTERLLVRERCKELQISKLVRELDLII